MPRTTTEECMQMLRESTRHHSRPYEAALVRELDAECAAHSQTIQAAEKLAERLESALLQLPPEYCKTEGYAECRAALAQYAALKEKALSSKPPDDLASSTDPGSDAGAFQGGRD